VAHRITFGSFELDLRRRLLSRDGALLAVGSRALDILCELVGAADELVSKDELMARVWPETIVEENNLQVHVSALRKVLEVEPGGRDWVQTVPGRGYRFVGPLQVRADEHQVTDALQQHVRFVRARDGVHIAAAVAGEGPPLVRTGLWMTHLEYDSATSLWGPLHARLAAATRLVRYDQRGTGLSDRQIPPLDFDALVGDLETVVDGLALERFALLAISQGVPTAIEYAARHPERVRCLVLVGGYAKGWRRRGNPALVERGEALQTITRMGWGLDNPAFRQLFTSLAIPDATREEMDSFNELQRRSASAEMAADFVRVTGGIDVSQRLPQVRVPTLILHSRDEAWVPAEQGRALAAGISGARFVPLPSASHIVLPREPAWEHCVREIVGFVREHGDLD
jgi:DNA-binding winged helix-turn-helix (wHTH) protein/alpha-beta hydrolase superfamily lysophospholipase